MSFSVLIEDKYAHQDPWISLYKKNGEDLKVFSHQEEFLEWCDKNKDQISEIKLLVTDQKTPGYDVLRNHFLLDFKEEYPSYQGISVLSNSLPYSIEEVEDEGYELVLDKEALTIEEIKKLISGRKSNK